MPVHGKSALAMLTRSGVAKKLGCSLATVRRLEGQELFPEQDQRGVHWFNEREVERVAIRMLRGQATSAQGKWLSRAGPGPRGVKLGPRSRTQSQAARRATFIRDSERVAELQRENERLREENADLQRRTGALLTGIEALLEHGPIEEVLALLEAACSDST